MASEKIFSQVAETVSKNPELFDEDYVRGITTARAIGLMELALGLSSLIIAIRTKKRSHKTWAKTSLVLGSVAVVFCIVHLITTTGAVFGSGSGKAGSIIALILGLIGIALANLTLRFRNTDQQLQNKGLCNIAPYEFFLLICWFQQF